MENIWKNNVAWQIKVYFLLLGLGHLEWKGRQNSILLNTKIEKMLCCLQIYNQKQIQYAKKSSALHQSNSTLNHNVKSHKENENNHLNFTGYLLAVKFLWWIPNAAGFMFDDDRTWICTTGIDRPKCQPS